MPFTPLTLFIEIVEFLIARESGCVSRDELLERMSVIMDENALWGPACNKAIRETFPDSTAMRKGKFKKYPFSHHLCSKAR